MKTTGNIVHCLFGGTERCDHCGQIYIYEMEYRCAACDGPVCPMCAQTAWDADVHCPACAGHASGKGS